MLIWSCITGAIGVRSWAHNTRSKCKTAGCLLFTNGWRQSNCLRVPKMHSTYTRINLCTSNSFVMWQVLFTALKCRTRVQMMCGSSAGLNMQFSVWGHQVTSNNVDVKQSVELEIYKCLVLTLVRLNRTFVSMWFYNLGEEIVGEKWAKTMMTKRFR